MCFDKQEQLVSIKHQLLSSAAAVIRNIERKGMCTNKSNSQTFQLARVKL